MKSLKTLSAALALAVIFLAANSIGVACTCLQMPVCMELNMGTTIFVGKLVQASETRTSNLYGKTETGQLGELLFEVVEPFAGVSEKTITVWSSGYGCGALYHLGETYLVFARQSKEHPLQAVSCSTYPLSQHFTKDNQPDSELKFLRDIAHRNLDGADLRVRVYLSANYSMHGEKSDTKDLPGVEVKIEGEGKELHAVTDHDGWYQVKGLKPGNYVVSIALPDGFLFAGDVKAKQEITLREYGCGTSVFNLSLNSGLRGTVKDENGKPVVGINVRLFSAELQDQIASEGFERSLYDDGVVTDGHGEYQFKSILPGKYIISTNFDGANSEFPYLRTFYPQTTDVKKTQIVSVEDGKTAGPFDVRLKSKLPMSTIEGIVVWPDGTPAVGARVELTLPDEFNDQAVVETDGSGKFSLNVVKDRDYKLRVEWQEDDSDGSEKHKTSPLGWRIARSEPEYLTVSKDIKGLKIVLVHRKL